MGIIFRQIKNPFNRRDITATDLVKHQRSIQNVISGENLDGLFVIFVCISLYQVWLYVQKENVSRSLHT